MSQPLAELLALLRQQMPELSCQQGCSLAHWLPDAAANQAALQLYQCWKSAYPEAGRHYWASRCWGLLIWQPVYAVVGSVHLAARCPRLDGMRLQLQGAEVCGFSLPSHAPDSAERSALIRCAGQRLQVMQAQLLEAVSVPFALPAKMAALLLADVLLSALLRLQPLLNASARQLQDWAAQWLLALGLPKARGFSVLTLAEGQQQVQLTRNLCCQHFRRRDGSLCADCPKLLRAQRLERPPPALIARVG